jgi:hypothetical protein
MKNLFLKEDQKNMEIPFDEANDLLENYKSILKFQNENIFLKEFFESIGTWILKNFSSPKLNSLLNFIILLFNKMGYTIEIQREGK